MKLRGALLGTGNIALRGHAPQWAQDEVLAREIEIVAVADLSPSNLDAVHALFPAATRYASADELLERERLDFVDICAPPFTHRPLIEDAAQRGLHVLCEKPLAPSLDDAERLARAVRVAGIVFRPCHQYHHSPHWQAVRNLLPRIGPIHMVDYEVHRTEANPGNPHWTPSWRTERDLSGGGILVDHGAHIFYQLRSVLGEPRRVQATVRTLQHHSYDVEDTAHVVLDFEHCLARVSLTWAARRREIRFRFVGEHGELSGDDQALQLRADTNETIDFAEGMSRDSSHSDWYAPLFREFAACIRSGNRSSEKLDEALYVTRLITRAYQSSREGRSLPLMLPATTPVAATSPVILASALEPEMILSDTMPTAPQAAPAAERRHRTRVLRIVAVVTLVAASAWTFHDVGWTSLWAAMTSADMSWIAAAAGINLVAVAFQAARWLALVRPVAPLATFGNAFKALIVGFAASTIVPARAGELARMQSFSRRTGLSHPAVLGSIVLDHLVNAAGLLFGLAVLPVFLKDVPLWIRPGAWFTLALFTVAAMLVFALRPFRSERAAASRPLPVKGLTGFLVSAREGLTATSHPRALALSLGASLVSWALEINVTVVALRAVGLHLPLSAAFLVLLAVNLALAFPFAPPGNLGTLEVGATLALVGFGVPKEQALAFGLVYHFLQVVPIGLLGLFFVSRASAEQPVAA